MTHLQQIDQWLEQAQISEAELARRCEYDKGNFHRMLRNEGGLSLAAAIRLFDATDLQLGPLEGLTKREIETARRLAA